MSQKLRWKKITRLKETGAVVSNCILFMERMDYIDKAKARFLALNWVTNNGFIFFFFISLEFITVIYSLSAEWHWTCYLSTIYLCSIALEWKNSRNCRTGGLSFSVLLCTVSLSNTLHPMANCTVCHILKQVIQILRDRNFLDFLLYQRESDAIGSNKKIL